MMHRVGIVLEAGSTAKRLGVSLGLAAILSLGIWPTAQAQNSPEATAAVQRHRAETGQTSRSTSPPATPAVPARGSWQAQLAACKEQVGFNPIGREQCNWRFCQGHWGEGECPPGNDRIKGQPAAANSNTPLGRCLREAGKNPIKRESCSWKHCKPHWSSAECKALLPPDRQTQ